MTKQFNPRLSYDNQIEKFKPTPGSGVFAGRTYRAQIARQILTENAKASQSVNDKRKGFYFGKNR